MNIVSHGRGGLLKELFQNETWEYVHIFSKLMMRMRAMKPGVVSDMALVLEALCGCRTDDEEAKVCASSEESLLTTITSLPMSKQRLAFSLATPSAVVPAEEGHDSWEVNQ